MALSLVMAKNKDKAHANGNGQKASPKKPKFYNFTLID